MTTDDQREPSNEDENFAHDQRFMELFGVSKADLSARGVDPDVYLRENLRRALKNPHAQAAILSESIRYRIRFFVYAKWFYVSAFAALLLLLLSGIHAFIDVRTALIVLCCAVAATAFVCLTLQVSYAGRYRAACKREGVVPRIYGSRRRL